MFQNIFFLSSTDQSEIPNALRRCYQEVTTHTGYFSNSYMNIPSPLQMPMWCEFVIRRADPTVCRVKLQLTARTFINLPCINNFIHLPDGERMCISVTEKSKYSNIKYLKIRTQDLSLYQFLKHLLIA